MALSIPDWKRAGVARAGLTAFAVLVVFGISPGGFEKQGISLLVLLPAALAAYPVSDFVYKAAPRAEPVVFWIFVASFNFLWYWFLSCVAIKIYRSLDGG
jgi:hypothetical protein